MSKNLARNRRYVRVLSQFQGGLCAICREPMLMVCRSDAENFDNPDRASLEHVNPKSIEPGAKSKFSNFVATHKLCNNSRMSEDASEELLRLREEVHMKIFQAGNPHIIRPQNGGSFDLDSIEFIIPFGVSIEQFKESEGLT